MFKKILLTLLTIMLAIVVAVGAYGAKVYYDIKKTASKIETPIKSESGEVVKKEPIRGDSFSIMLLGIDTGEEGRVDQGRSDTMIVATVNPKTNKTTMVSVPRDTYTEIVGYDTKDKINHAYAFGGVKMAQDSLSNLLQIPIDHYVSIDMKGLEDLVDGVGGITVQNDLAFSQSGHDFAVGELKLNGSEALAYSRMRKQDPEGDYGRQQRQQRIIEAIVNEAMSLSTITGYQSMLTTISNNMQTDLSWEDLTTLSKKYRSAMSQTTNEVLTGEGTMMNGVSYQIVPENELSRVQEVLKNELK